MFVWNEVLILSCFFAECMSFETLPAIYAPCLQPVAVTTHNNNIIEMCAIALAHRKVCSYESEVACSLITMLYCITTHINIRCMYVFNSKLSLLMKCYRTEVRSRNDLCQGYADVDLCRVFGSAFGRVLHYRGTFFSRLCSRPSVI